VKLLAITTSTPRGGAAIVDDKRVLAAVAYEDAKGHAERLLAAVDDVLAAAGLARGDVDALGCDVGPGSFAGVRVAVAAAKGVALALDLPVAGVGSLEAMAAAAFGEGHAPPDAIVLAALDAKKGELFVAAYGADLEPALAPCHVAREGAAARLAALPAGRSVVLVGEVLASLDAVPGPLVRAPSVDLPDATWVASRARARLAAGGHRAADAAALEAIYVRPPDAKPMAQGARAAG
jgi:tRNA threonylcarbamoyladenosine biosynthesis protein TsaB